MRNTKLLFCITLALAVGLRLVFWQIQARSGAVQPGDPEEYYRAALHILQGGYHDTGKWLRPPLYPAFLALVFSIVGVDLVRSMLVQAVLSGLSVPVFGLLAWRLFGRRDAALVSAGLAAVFVPLASFASVLFAEGLFVVLIVAALAALVRSCDSLSYRDALVCGMLLGLAALTRAMALSFIPIAALLMLARLSGRQQLAQREVGLPFTARVGSGLGLALVLGLGAALVILPWAARNYAVHQRLIIVDTNGGISMWFGAVRSDAEQRAGEAELWAIPNLADRQARALEWTQQRILEDPAWFIGRMRFKIVSLYLLQVRSFVVGDIITISPQDQQVALGAGENPLFWSIIADTQYVIIMLLALATLCFAPQPRRLLPIVLWVLFSSFMSAITIGHPRLRLPIVAALIPLAGYALVRLADLWRCVRGQGLFSGTQRSKGVLRFMVLLLSWAIFAALIFSTRYLSWLPAEQLALRGRQALAAGNTALARSYYEQARSADPNNALRSLVLADLDFAGKQYQAALEGYAAATQQEDRNLYAHAMRGRTAALLGRRDIAQNEQSALAGYGRDNNELALWAWEFFDDAPGTRVVPGDATQFGQYVGFAPATADLPHGRWTLGHARLRLAGSCAPISVLLHGPPGREVSLGVQGAVARSFMLTGRQQQLMLEQSQTCQPGVPIIVEITSSTGLLDIETAPWMVGVAVEAVGFR